MVESDIVSNVNMMSKSKNRPDTKPPLEIINEEPKSFIANEPLRNSIDKNGEEENNLTTSELLKTEDQVYAMRINDVIIPITSIIPEHKLLNATDDDVLFQSNVKRLLNQKIGNHISQTFCDRFCVMTRNVVKLYKSREQFLKMSKPTNVFPMNGVKSVKRFHLKGNNKLHFFVIELSDWNNIAGKILLIRFM
jgi:hypothetical protein